MRWLSIVTGVVTLFLSWPTTASPTSALIEHAHQMEARYEIPFGLLAEACHTESRWRNVQGDQGRSIGVCQIQPATVMEVAGGNPYHAQAKSVAWMQGSADATVAVIQTALIGRGYEIDADGIFGVNTDAAVRSFQRSNFLRSDGIVGPKTWNKLLPGNPYPGKTITQALWNEKENIEWAARILRYRFEQCGHGSWTLAISAYNGGCGNSVVVHTGRVLDNWKGKIVYLPTDPR